MGVAELMVHNEQVRKYHSVPKGKKTISEHTPPSQRINIEKTFSTFRLFHYPPVGL